MSGPLVVLSGTTVPVAPGNQASVKVSVTNPDRVVQGYHLEVRGEGVAEWARVNPVEVSLMPNEEATATVAFTPPAGHTAPAGSYPFCVRAWSTQDPDTSAVAEGDVHLGAISGLQAKLVPLTSSGRWRGRHSLHVTNWGNAPAQLRLRATDPDEALGLLPRPELLQVPVGRTVVADVAVRTRRPRLRGPAARLPFTVAVEPDARAPGPAPDVSTPERPLVSGAFQQKPILGPVLVPIALVLGLLVTAGVLYERRLEDPDLPTLGDGTVPPVRGFSVKPVDEQGLQLRWSPAVGIDGFRVSQSAGEGDPEEIAYQADHAANGKLVDKLPPGTRKCFTIEALRGENRSVPSDQKCAKTKAAPKTSAKPSASGSAPSAEPSASKTSGSQPAPSRSSSSGGTSEGSPTGSSASGSSPTTPRDLDGSYVAAGSSLSTAVGIRDRLDDDLEKLQKAKLPAGLLLTDDYQLTPARGSGEVFRNASWVVYAGPYGMASEAEAVCEQVQELSFQGRCRVYLVRRR